VVEALHCDGSTFLVHLSLWEVHHGDGSSSASANREEESAQVHVDTNERLFAGRVVSADREAVRNDPRTARIIIDQLGIILYVSEQFLEIFKYKSEDDILGENIK